MGGAVAIVTEASWGGSFKVRLEWPTRHANPRQLEHVELTPELVLPCFQAATTYNYPAVNLEVARSIRRLVQIQGGQLPASAWDSIFDIFSVS